MHTKFETKWKVDWLTMSLIPIFEVPDCDRFYSDILKFLGLGEFENLFVKKSGGINYTKTMRYNDISVKIPDSFNADVQGFCIEFTGHGIDYYIEQMRSVHKDYNVCNLLASFLSLAEGGAFTCNISRLDVAIDDISYEEKCSLQGTTQGNGLTGADMPVRFSM